MANKKPAKKKTVDQHHGRKTRFPGPRVQKSFKLPAMALAAAQKKAGELTEKDGQECTLTEAIAWCVFTATGTPMPAGNLNR
jgi:hypothetical protein